MDISSDDPYPAGIFAKKAGETYMITYFEECIIALVGIILAALPFVAVAAMCAS